MTYEYEYTNEQERQVIISSNDGKYLIGEKNLIDGNFLVFADEPLKPPTVYVTVPEEYLTEQEMQVDQLKAENLTLMEAVADLYEMVMLGAE